MKYAFEEKISNTLDFPTKGIQFKDISPAMWDAYSFKDMIEALNRVCPEPKGGYLGIESRGFPFASALAYRNGKGFRMIRKPGKAVPPVYQEKYQKEYGEDILELQPAVNRGDEVVIIDDLVALGGSMCAAIRLAKKAGYKVIACASVIELEGLGGRQKIENEEGIPYFSLVQYEEK